MTKHERHQKILEYLSCHESLRLEEACALFQASPASIRRDFAIMAADGFIKRVRGGIKPKMLRYDKLQPINLRMNWYSEEKCRLAEAVGEYVKDAESLFIDGGSTTAHLGAFLRNPQQIILTNSVALCTILTKNFPLGGGPIIQLIGGRFYPENELVLGSNAENSISQYRADVAVLSVRGIDETGLYNNNEQIAGIARGMIAHARQTVILADHTKIGAKAMNRVCDIRGISALFTTETSENKETLEKIRSLGIQVFTN